MTGLEQLTLFAEDTPANLSAQQERGGGRKMKDISGQKCLDLYALSGRDGLLPKTLKGILNSVSTPYLMIWKLRTTPSGHLLLQLVRSERRTKEIGCGLLPTPTTQEIEHPNLNLTKSGRRLSKNLKTSHSLNLADIARMWPTPQASDNRDRGNLSSGCVKRRIAKGKQISLSQSVSEVSGQLNPQWVEWLMGFPQGWTDLKPLETQ